jgi:hypothetical protein
MALRQDETEERAREAGRFHIPRQARARVAEPDEQGWVIAATLLAALAAATVLTALF